MAEKAEIKPPEKAKNNFEELLSSKFLIPNEPQPVADMQPLKNFPVVCLLFSAKWCPPCVTFLPELIEFYNDVNLEEKLLEIIYISKDKSKEEFEEFYSEMPWLAIPYNDSRLKKLVDLYEVKAIPVLALLKKNGELISKECKKEVCEQGPDVFQKWYEMVFPPDIK